MAAKHKRLGSGRSANQSRPRKRRYLVVTNGEVTEPQYFKNLRGSLMMLL